MIKNVHFDVDIYIRKEQIFMECRSEERRQYIVNNYNVVPVAHIQLLNGQTKHSDAGQTIENDYYIFEATSKANGKKGDNPMWG